MNFPTIEGLTAAELDLYTGCVDAWRANLNKNQNRLRHYAGKLDMRDYDLGVSVPPPILRKLSRQAVMWSRKAVTALANCSTLEGVTVHEDAPDGFDEAMAANDLCGMYDQVKLSELVHCCMFWTVTPGWEGEPPVVVNAYDAEHAGGLWDYRRKRFQAGAVISDVDPKDPEQPTAVTLYTDDAVITCRRTSAGRWSTERRTHRVGRPLMEPMAFSRDLRHPFGRSRLTPAIMQLEEDVNREIINMIVHSELYTAPTRWVMGAPDEIFANGRIEAYLGSIFALPRDAEGDAPSTGAYPISDMQPHVALVRQYANMFASEASIPVHSLLYTEANPASAEAIQAAENDLVKLAQDMNRGNAQALRNVARLACSLLTETPFYSMPRRDIEVQWADPTRPSLAAQADAMVKLASIVEDLPDLTIFWEGLGYSAEQIDRIMRERRRANGRRYLATQEVTVEGPEISG